VSAEQPQEQLSLGLRDPYYRRRRAERFDAAVKSALRRRGTIAEVAAELDAMFSPLGRPVTESTLRACLGNTERNYARVEWAGLVIDDPEVQAAMQEPLVSSDEELRLLRDYLKVEAAGVLRAFDRALGRPT
jgi:hypothetical protein